MLSVALFIIFVYIFTRPGPYSISPLVLAGKQKGYAYPTIHTCYKFQEKKGCQKFCWHVLQPQFQCVPLMMAHIVVVVYPLPWPLLSGGESDVPACGPPASFSVHLASSAVTPAGSVHKSRGDNVVRMWVQLKR